MPTQRRPPMPKLSPFALAPAQTRRKRPYHLLIFFLVFALPLFAIHLALLSMPFFWDELGQFVPTALDLYRTGSLVPHSAIPNVHPPGVEVYLALLYKIFGFSIVTTRVAMLLVASAGVLVLFLLSIELSRGSKGAPAFLPPLFLLASPLFFTQSMMAQLDMPAMVVTLLALLLFIRKQYLATAAVSVLLVLVKETGLVTPVVFCAALLYQRNWRAASYFAAPAIGLGAWLIFLHKATGYWLGDPGFAHYNVRYALHPVRVLVSLLRRIYYLFFAEFRWIGALLLASVLYQSKIFRRPEWLVTFATSVGSLLLVSILGGAELERYLLPVLPIFYIAVSIAISYQRRWIAVPAAAVFLVGLIANLFWNPVYPFPFENNLAMVDFVRLQEVAARFAGQSLANKTIATAWPYTQALRIPDYGFVQRKLNIVETGDFSLQSIKALPPESFDVLIVYTRTWVPEGGVTSIAMARRFLQRFFDWRPEITAEQCLTLGLHQAVSWNSRGQTITVYLRGSLKSGKSSVI